jgi:hypothetical protein
MSLRLYLLVHWLDSPLSFAISYEFVIL